jgi:hypothetical protein
VLPGIVEATPRLATPLHAPSSTPRHASHHARPRRVTPRTTPRPPPESCKSPDEHKELIYTGFLGKLLTSQGTRRPSGGR